MSVATMSSASAAVPPALASRHTAYVTQLQDQICAALEALEQRFATAECPAAAFAPKHWQRANDGGGGEMRLLSNGAVFDRAGVNVSTVWGKFDPKFAGQIPGTEQDASFWACGISLVLHPRNPFVPAVHANLRHLVTGKAWFGGGADLTPCFHDAAEAAAFHQAMQGACDAHDPDYYPKFKQWCDEYFFLPHRNESRGIGGIFFDYLEGDLEQTFAFVQSVGNAFLEVYPRLVAAKADQPWTPADKRVQALKRGRYIEFNLLYDRGTKFGLETGGNVDAIFVSLPPGAEW
jgi:coproporphyrinogen III oxidase